MKARWMVAWLILVIALAGGVIVGASTCYRGVTCEARGNCWFATWSGVMVRAAEGVWVNFTPSNSGLLHPYCHEVAVDAAGRVWVTHHMLGISLLDYGTSVVDITDDRWLTFTKADGLGSDFMIGAVAIDSQGRKWFGHDSGISILDDKGTPFDKSDDAWTQYIGGQSGLAVGPVNDILFDSQGCAWAATDFGVSRFCGGWTEFTWPGYPGGGWRDVHNGRIFPRTWRWIRTAVSGWQTWAAAQPCGTAANGLFMICTTRPCRC